MKEIPILFSAPMVRALLAGTKTQTRRAWRDQPPAGVRVAYVPGQTRSPYGQPGDRLWVRETYYAWGRWETRFSAKKGRDEWHFVDMTLESGKAYLHPATDPQPQPMGGKRHKGGVTPTWWKRPAIFMPRAASRITLEVTEVRVERLQDISEADAQAEGCALECMTPTGDDSGSAIYGPGGYLALWDSINGPGSWEANPWVWAVSFKRITP